MRRARGVGGGGDGGAGVVVGAALAGQAPAVGEAGDSGEDRRAADADERDVLQAGRASATRLRGADRERVAGESGRGSPGASRSSRRWPMGVGGRAADVSDGRSACRRRSAWRSPRSSAWRSGSPGGSASPCRRLMLSRGRGPVVPVPDGEGVRVPAAGVGGGGRDLRGRSEDGRRVRRRCRRPPPPPRGLAPAVARTARRHTLRVTVDRVYRQDGSPQARSSAPS